MLHQNVVCLSQDELNLLSAFRSMSADNRRALLLFAQLSADAEHKLQACNVVSLAERRAERVT